MANMSYCRFRNTSADLGDCLDALSNEEELSKEEFYACEGMFEQFINFCVEHGIIDEEYEDDIRTNLVDFIGDIEHR